MALERVRLADALKARDTGVTTALVIPREGVLPGQSVLLNLSGEKAEAMVLKQPAALHLHMATLPRQYPGSLMGTVAYARQALYDAARYREEWAAYERAPAGTSARGTTRPCAAWQDVLAGKQTLSSRPAARTTCAARSPCRRVQARVAVAGAPQAARARAD